MIAFMSIGIVLMIILLIFMIRSSSNTTSPRKNQISHKRLEDMILPNNKGRSIDDIVKNLKKNGVSPDFHL